MNSLLTLPLSMGVWGLPQMGMAQSVWRTLGSDSAAVEATLVSAWREGVAVGGSVRGTLWGRAALGGSDAWLIHLDTALRRRWTYPLRSRANVELSALASNASDDLYWAALFSDSLWLGSDTVLYAPRPTVALARHRADGQLMWARQLPASGLVRLPALAADSAGVLYATGSFQDTLWLDGRPPLVTTARQAPLLLRLEPNGALAWAQTATLCLDAQGTAVALDDAGQPYWAAVFNGPLGWPGAPDTLHAHWVYRDILLQRLSPRGQLRWSQHHSGPYDNACTHLAFQNGALYAAGHFRGALDWPPLRLQNPFQFLSASYVVQLDAHTGFARWAQQSRAIASSEVLGFSIQHHRLALCGTFQDSFAWGGSAFTALGSAEAYQLQLDTQGQTTSATAGLGPGFDLWRGTAWDHSGGRWTVGGFQKRLDWADSLSATAPGTVSGIVWRVASAAPTAVTPVVRSPQPELVPIKLVPNPARDSVRLLLPPDAVVQSWRIYNGKGQLVAQGAGTVVPVHALPTGTYSLQVTTNTGWGAEVLLVGD